MDKVFSCTFHAEINLVVNNIDSILRETESLAKQGYVDISFIAQDTSSYLKDKHIDSGLLTGTISSVSTLPLTDEKSTLNVLASGVTFALELIVNELENAAKPNVKPVTATQSATTAITLELLSIILSPYNILIY